eukprot:TRINITY_DN4890_c0_g1_i16.p1 TRINITY_DN4890_c0_g1~~TRINITY_DN4890_c0_g1_i16.p1  ORF type:complete len:513 (-),score=161.28 TRINITY_DN4890_c0_g1_i16:6-1544(-)
MQLMMIVWNEKVLGIATKKGYVALDPLIEAIHSLCDNSGTLYPNLLTFNDSWVVISGDNACVYDKYCKLVTGAIINIQATAKHPAIVSMLIKNHYLIILRESSVNIYNLLDYSMIQAIEVEKGDMPKDISGDLDKLFILYESTGIKKETISKLVYLRLLSSNEQIQRLLSTTKVNEAYKVFTQNTSINDPEYKSKKEAFFLEAGWSLFLAFDYTKAIECLSNANYDPFEFLALLPDFASADLPAAPLQNIKDVVELKLGMSDTKDTVLSDGINAVVKLLAKKRKLLAPIFPKEKAKTIEFLHPSKLLNEVFKDHTATLAKTMEMLDTSLIKLYIGLRNLKDISEFFTPITTMGCDYSFSQYLEEQKSSEAQVCLAYFNEKYGNFTKALEVWKKLASENSTGDLACREIIKLLTTQVTDKNIIFDCTEVVLRQQPEEGLKVFTSNESLPKFITEDDIIEYLGGLKNNSEMLKEKYIEHIAVSYTHLRAHETSLHLVCRLLLEKKKKKKKNKKK